MKHRRDDSNALSSGGVVSASQHMDKESLNQNEDAASTCTNTKAERGGPELEGDRGPHLGHLTAPHPVMFAGELNPVRASRWRQVRVRAGAGEAGVAQGGGLPEDGAVRAGAGR